MNNGLVLGAVLSLAMAIVYGYVGYRTSKRPVDAHALLASRTFMVWWYALGATSAVAATRNIAAASGVLDLAFYTTLTYVNILLLCIALWGLLYYLLYVYTGKRSLLGPLSLGYAAYFTVLVYYISAADPAGVIIGQWDVRVQYTQDLAGAFTNTLLLLLVGPQILAALAYSLLFFQVEGRSQRFRVAVVSWSIMLWFGAALVGSLTGLNAYAAWNVVSRLIALAATLAILVAFAPPRWMRDRFDLELVDAPGGAHRS